MIINNLFIFCYFLVYLHISPDISYYFYKLLSAIIAGMLSQQSRLRLALWAIYSISVDLNYPHKTYLHILWLENVNILVGTSSLSVFYFFFPCIFVSIWLHSVGKYPGEEESTNWFSSKSRCNNDVDYGRNRLNRKYQLVSRLE